MSEFFLQPGTIFESSPGRNSSRSKDSLRGRFVQLSEPCESDHDELLPLTPNLVNLLNKLLPPAAMKQKQSSKSSGASPAPVKGGSANGAPSSKLAPSPKPHSPATGGSSMKAAPSPKNCFVLAKKSADASASKISNKATDTLKGILKKEKGPVKIKNLSVRFAPLVDADVHAVADYFERRTNNFVMDSVLMNIFAPYVLADPDVSPGVSELLAAAPDPEKQCKEQLMAPGFVGTVGSSGTGEAGVFGGGETSWIGLAINSLICAPRKAVAGLAVWEEAPAESGGVPINSQEDEDEDDDDDDDEEEDEDDEDDDDEDDDDDDDEEEEEEEGSSDGEGSNGSMGSDVSFDEMMEGALAAGAMLGDGDEEEIGAQMEAKLKEHKVFVPEEDGLKWWTLEEEEDLVEDAKVGFSAALYPGDPSGEM